DDARLIQHRVAIVPVVVRDTVDHVVVRRTARAADTYGEEPAAWLALHAGRDREKRVEVPTAERNLQDAFSVDVVIQLVRELDKRRHAGDGDGFRLCAHFHPEV